MIIEVNIIDVHICLWLIYNNNSEIQITLNSENCVACFIMSQTIRVGNFVMKQDILFNFIVHMANIMSTMYTTNLHISAST